MSIEPWRVIHKKSILPQLLVFYKCNQVENQWCSKEIQSRRSFSPSQQRANTGERVPLVPSRQPSVVAVMLRVPTSVALTRGKGSVVSLCAGLLFIMYTKSGTVLFSETYIA